MNRKKVIYTSIGGCLGFLLSGGGPVFLYPHNLYPQILVDVSLFLLRISRVLLDPFQNILGGAGPEFIMYSTVLYTIVGGLIGLLSFKLVNKSK